MKKSIIKRITAAAATLPEKLESRQHTTYHTRAEILEVEEKFGLEHVKLPPGKQSFPSKTPRVFPVDHVQKMKHAYTAGGWSAVEQYIKVTSSNMEDGAVSTPAVE